MFTITGIPTLLHFTWHSAVGTGMPHNFVAIPTSLGDENVKSSSRSRFRNLQTSEQYQQPENTLEVEVRNPRTHGSARSMYTDYEITVTSNIPIFRPSSVVRRRYSDFAAFKEVLARDLPRVHVPPLPPKVFTNRFSDDVVQTRKVQLDRFLQQVATHPLVQTGASRLLVSFLQDEVWDKDQWLY